MRFFWMAAGGAAGVAAGAVAGFALAMLVASIRPSPNDGSFGMREVLACLPSGALIGLLLGTVLGGRHAG